jgi:glycine/D-amino acid oxidase-like deaminating enzyme
MVIHDMRYDYLLVGQGIAGTVLAATLLEQGKRVVVIDQGMGHASSGVAAGIFNPITGRKMVKTWLCDALFPALHQFYPALEKRLAASFYYPKAVYVPFDSVEKQNDWMATSSSPAYAPYIRGFQPPGFMQPAVKGDFGGMLIEGAGHVDIPAMLTAFRHYLNGLGAFREEVFDYGALELAGNQTVRYHDLEADKLIFCEGYKAIENPFFNWLPFRPVKGELLEGVFEGFDTDLIVNRGCWVMPTGLGTYKVGATYDQQDLTLLPTEKARAEIMEKLEALMAPTFQLQQQKAGIRPATYDRRPFVGIHPVHAQLAVFNGLGTKGVSLAPYFAREFVKYLGGEENNLTGLVDVGRVFIKFPELKLKLANL